VDRVGLLTADFAAGGAGHDRDGLWLPVPWLVEKRRRKRVGEIEAELRQDAGRWKRYQALKRELRSWNWLESSVALAAAATGAALVAAIR
jgi:hypothetical protein